MSDRGLAVITGAAGGMGHPVAVRLAAEGRALLLCDLNAERLEQVAAPLRADGAQVEIFAGDIADPGYPARLVAAIGDRSVGALVHTAGLSPTMAEGPRIFEVNYFATERLVTAILPKMAREGCAVLISSSSAYMAIKPEIDAAIAALLAGDAEPVLAMTTAPNTAYPISKRAVIALVAREAAAFGARGARIASIAPGFIETAMSRQELASNPRMAEMMTHTPLARWGSGDEIASVAQFLCSPAASYVSGCDIKVDGGALAALGY